MIAGFDPLNDYYSGLWGPGVDDNFLPPLPRRVPNYLSALDLDFVRGKRIGYNNTLPAADGAAVAALAAAGAIMVERPTISPPGIPGGIFHYEAQRDINPYYHHLGPDAPINSLTEEIADNQANAHEALKFGNNNHAGPGVDISPDSAASVIYRTDLVSGKRSAARAIDRMLANDTPADPSDDFIAIIGNPPNPPRAGYPRSRSRWATTRPSGARSTC